MTTTPAPDSRLTFPDKVVSGRIIGMLPDEPVDAVAAAVEVMIQERIAAFSLPVHDTERRHALLRMFRRRACLGVHGVVTADDVPALVDEKVAFVLATGAGDDALAALRRAGIPAATDALTPTEMRAAWARGVDAVQVAPADVGSATYGDSLAQLVPDALLIPRGGVGSYSMRRWLSAGAVAVCLDEILVGDAASDGSLPALRERCRSVRAIVDDPECPASNNPNAWRRTSNKYNPTPHPLR